MAASERSKNEIAEAFARPPTKPTESSLKLNSRRARAVSVKQAIAATALLIILAIWIPPAHAANIVYASGLITSENQFRYSGLKSNITGGSAKTQPFSADGATVTVIIETYRDKPGYRTLHRAAGGNSVSFKHSSQKNSKQKCNWDFPWGGGNVGKLRLTCSYRTP